MVDLERVTLRALAAVDPSRYVQTRPDQIARARKSDASRAHAFIAYLITKARDCDARVCM